jgi:hypothetical protein
MLSGGEIVLLATGKEEDEATTVPHKDASLRFLLDLPRSRHGLQTIDLTVAVDSSRWPGINGLMQVAAEGAGLRRRA